MEEDPDKHKQRSARTTFFNHILKRPDNSKVQSLRYEDITPGFPLQIPEMASSNKRFKLFRPRTDDSEEMDSTEQSPKVPLLVQFYDPEVKARDAVGRTLDDILEWEDARLEQCHNYIQMLFPLPEGSIFNMQAPVVSREVLEAFRARSELRGRLRGSFVRILRFYGFEIESLESEENVADGAESKGKGDNEHDPNPGANTEAAVEPTQGLEDDGSTGAEENQLESVENNTASDERKTDQHNVTTQNTISGEQQPETTDTPAAQSNDEEPGTTESESLQNGAKSISTAVAESSKTTSKTTQKYPPFLPPVLKVVRARHWKSAFRNWAIRFDHNHLRITRILRSLRVLGLQEECDAFYTALKEVYNEPDIMINERSMSYWHKAIRNALHIAPDGERVAWLKRWVEEQQEGKHAEPKSGKQKDEH